MISGLRLSSRQFPLTLVFALIHQLFLGVSAKSRRAYQWVSLNCLFSHWFLSNLIYVDFDGILMGQLSIGNFYLNIVCLMVICVESVIFSCLNIWHLLWVTCAFLLSLPLLNFKIEISDAPDDNHIKGYVSPPTRWRNCCRPSRLVFRDFYQSNILTDVIIKIF